jgi:hypothetical protein
MVAGSLLTWFFGGLGSELFFALVFLSFAALGFFHIIYRAIHPADEAWLKAQMFYMPVNPALEATHKEQTRAEEAKKYIEFSAVGKKSFTAVKGASDSYPKPGRLLHPTPENFEEYCAEWCRYLNYQDAVKTQNSRDGGIDIRASNMIAQVKFQANSVGVGPIRELNGVKRGNQETLFFALNGYTPEARREASEIGMTLITVRPVEGTIDITA